MWDIKVLKCDEKVFMWWKGAKGLSGDIKKWGRWGGGEVCLLIKSDVVEPISLEHQLLKTVPVITIWYLSFTAPNTETIQKMYILLAQFQFGWILGQYHKLWKATGEASKGDEKTIKGDEEALNGDRKALNGDREVWNGNIDVLKGDGRHSIVTENIKRL